MPYRLCAKQPSRCNRICSKDAVNNVSAHSDTLTRSAISCIEHPAKWHPNKACNILHRTSCKSRRSRKLFTFEVIIPRAQVIKHRLAECVCRNALSSTYWRTILFIPAPTILWYSSYLLHFHCFILLIPSIALNKMQLQSTHQRL